ncbi:MAG: TolC family protein [Terriglobia bacterium]
MSRINRPTLIAAALLCTFCVLPQLYAQNKDNSENSFNQAIASTYTHTNWFPNIAAPYLNPRVPPFHLVNSEDLFQLIQNGTMRLSLDDAISLAIENNLDIAVARYNPQYAQIDKVRANSGAATRGITGAFTSSAEFSGAIGGGVGAGSGGFNSGGAGTATGGSVINSVGSVSSFDPVVSFFTGIGYRVSPLSTATVNGVNILSTNEAEYFGSISQAFPTGTSFSISMGGSRLSTNALTQLFNPLVDTSVSIGVEQNLLNGFGYRANKRYIYIAENDIGIAKDYFREQVSATIQTILNDYWTLAQDKQNVAVAEEADKYDAKLLSDNKRQVQIGTMAPLDVIQAESALATADQNLIVAQTTYRQQQEVMKTALSKQVTGPLLTTTIDPTTPLPQPKPGDAPSLEAAISEAHANRPEIDLNRLNLKNENIILKNNRNALLPTLNVSASLQPTGQNGNEVIFAPGGFVPTGQKIPGGLGDAFSQVFHNHYPGYSVALTLSMPIRNRTAQADAARALLEEHYLRTTVQQQLNTIDQDVRTAEIGVVQGKARVDAAQKAVQYAREQLTDEQKKFQVGESTVTLVLQMQSALTTAEGNLVTAQAGYAQALTTLQEATGAILQDNNVELVQALTGKVSRTLNIPGTPENPNPPGAPPGANSNPTPQGGDK